MADQPSTADQVAAITKQLTTALFRGDQLRRQRKDLDRDIELNEANVSALQNIVAGVELGKQVVAERAAADKAAAEKAAANSGPAER